MIRKSTYGFLLGLIINITIGISVGYTQEHFFTQFTSSPLSINPAFTGSADEDWRFSSIIKRQWIGKIEPISTQNLSIDGRVKNLKEKNYFGLGGFINAENILGGYYKTNYLNISTSYHQPIDENGNGLSLGLGFIQGSNRIDQSQLYFDQQISNNGFNNTLSSGETTLGNRSTFNSACLGIMYTYDAEDSYFDAGISGYQFIHSNRTLLNSTDQKIKSRYSIHADYGILLNETINANASAVLSRYAGMNLLTAAANFGFLINGHSKSEENISLVNLGMIYKMNAGIAPLIGYTFNEFQFGISYDVNISQKSGIANTYKNVELSLKYKRYLPNYVRKPGRYNSPF